MATKEERELRIRAAKDLLLYTNFGTREISRKLGFNCEGDFRNFFRRYVHTTPIKWRAGHHLYNPEIAQAPSRLITLRKVLDIPKIEQQSEYIGTMWLVPDQLTVVDSIEAVLVNDCSVDTVSGVNLQFHPQPYTRYSAADRRINTCCTRGVHMVVLAVSTRHSTIDLRINAAQPIARIMLDFTLKVSSPVLPENAVLWSAGIS